jgi:Arc/MetJ family transcription regulator
MRTTINIPEELVVEAMRLTHLKTKTDVVREGLLALIRKEKLKKIKNFQGKIDFGINLDSIRNR